MFACLVQLCCDSENRVLVGALLIPSLFVVHDGLDSQLKTN